MAKFEIAKEKAKGKPRQPKAPATEQQSETNEDEKQQKYLDIEQEVKETELKTNSKGAAGEATDTNAVAAKKESETNEAEGRTATDASAAHAAAAIDENIERRQAAAPEGTAATEEQEMNEKDERIRALIQKREDYCEARKRSKILGKVKGIKNISSIKSAKKRILIPKVRNKDGEAAKTRQGIANVFAKFYEDLYKGEDDHSDEDMSSCIDHENADSSLIETVPEITTEEIQAAIDRLNKGKAIDSSGIRAEQLKICSEDTKEKIRTIFNEIAQQEDVTSKSWRRIRIQVIHKKGDTEDPGNYRPICGLPILYKLFATVFYARLAPSLHKIQPPDQAGFRPKHRCEDHLTVFRILEQQCQEWCVLLYISTIDFTKAFDSIKHSYGILCDFTESSQLT